MKVVNMIDLVSVFAEAWDCVCTVGNIQCCCGHSYEYPWVIFEELAVTAYATIFELIGDTRLICPLLLIFDRLSNFFSCIAPHDAYLYSYLHLSASLSLSLSLTLLPSSLPPFPPSPHSSSLHLLRTMYVFALAHVYTYMHAPINVMQLICLSMTPFIVRLLYTHPKACHSLKLLSNDEQTHYVYLYCICTYTLIYSYPSHAHICMSYVCICLHTMLSPCLYTHNISTTRSITMVHSHSPIELSYMIRQCSLTIPTN